MNPTSLLNGRSHQIASAQSIINLAWQYRASRVVIVAHRAGVFRALARYVVERES